MKTILKTIRYCSDSDIKKIVFEYNRRNNTLFSLLYTDDGESIFHYWNQEMELNFGFIYQDSIEKECRTLWLKSRN